MPTSRLPSQQTRERPTMLPIRRRGSCRNRLRRIGIRFFSSFPRNTIGSSRFAVGTIILQSARRLLLRFAANSSALEGRLRISSHTPHLEVCLPRCLRLNNRFFGKSCWPRDEPEQHPCHRFGFSDLSERNSLPESQLALLVIRLSP